jgi:dephospho-CoA kinase
MKPFILGLTGGIGCGKSAVASRLRQRHPFVHVDADVLARQAFSDCEPLLRALAPGAVIDGVLHRPTLFRLMLEHPQLKTAVEALIHPRVKVAADHDLQRTDDRDVLLDVPLLFEAGMQTLCTTVLVVTCDPTVQVQRVMARSGYSEDLTRKIIGSQMSAVERERLADHVIRNDGTLADLETAVDTFLQQWKESHAA